MAKSSFDNKKIALYLSGLIIAGSFALSANIAHAAPDTILLASAAKMKKVKFTPIIDGDLLPFISVTSQKLSYLEPAAIYKFPVKMGRNCRLYVIGLFGVKPLRWPGWKLTKWDPKTGEIEYQKEVGHGIVEDQIPLIVSLPSDTTIDVLRPHFRATCGKGDEYHEARSNDYIGVSGSQSQPGPSPRVFATTCFRESGGSRFSRPPLASAGYSSPRPSASWWRLIRACSELSARAFWPLRRSRCSCSRFVWHAAN